MFGWFKKRKPEPTSTADTPLYFKDTQAAFEFACKYLDADLSTDTILPALVLDSAGSFGSDSSIHRAADGTQMAMLRICSKDSGFMVIASSASAAGPALQPGDLVAWHAGMHAPELASQFPDQRSGWVGLIIAKLKPEYRPDRGWAVEQKFQQNASPPPRSSGHYDWKSGAQSCPQCSWSGLGSETEIGETFDEGAEYHCPKCGHRFGFVAYPLLEESLTDPRAPESDRMFAEIALRRGGNGDAP